MEIRTGLRPEVTSFYMPGRPVPPRISTPTENVDLTMSAPHASVQVFVTTFYGERYGVRFPVSSHMGEREPEVWKCTERQAYPVEHPAIAEAWGSRLSRAHPPADLVLTIEKDRDDLASRDLVEYTAEWYEVTL